MRVEYDGYHGTSVDACTQILKECHFRKSCQSTEWAGTGTYFFIEDTPVENAKKWARWIRGYSQVAVLKASITMDADQLFDVTNTFYREQFHRFRERYFQKAKEEAERAGKKIDETVLQRMQLDCVVFDRICEKLGFTAVKRQCYIRFLHCGKWKDYPPSSIPNCTILCVRDEIQISKMKRIV